MESSACPRKAGSGRSRIAPNPILRDGATGHRTPSPVSPTPGNGNAPWTFAAQRPVPLLLCRRPLSCRSPQEVARMEPQTPCGQKMRGTTRSVLLTAEVNSYVSDTPAV